MYQGTRKTLFNGYGKKEGVEKLPLLQAPVRQEKSFVSLKEGWALQVVKKAYRFSEK